METLAGELDIAVRNARAALAEARGTEFEAYLSKLVGAGEKARAEVSTRGAADLRELIAALNEGARATILTLNGRKQLAARRAERAVATTETQAVAEAKATQDRPAQTTIKAEAVQVKAEPEKIEVAQVEAVETKPIEVAKEAATEEILVPNTSTVEAAGVSEMASEWGAVALVLVTMVAMLGILAAQWRQSKGLRNW